MISPYPAADRFAETLRRYALPVAVLAGGIAFQLFSSGHSVAAQYLLLSSALTLIFGGNLGRKDRHRQWLFPFLSILLLIALVIVLWRFRLGYQGLVPQLDVLTSPLGIQLSPQIAGLLALLNGLLLVAWAAIKWFVAVVIRVSAWIPWKFGAGRTDIAAASGAYAFSPRQGWQLKPQWFFVRQFAVGLTLLSVIGLMACWQVFSASLQAASFPLLPAALLILFGEIAAYLGGEHDPGGAIRFGGEGVASNPWANYEKVWRELRKSVWKEQWLAAHKRFIEEERK